MSTEPPIPERRVVLIDREYARSSTTFAALRRCLRDQYGAGFADWACAPDRGRFIVLTVAPGNLDMAERFKFTDDFDDALEIVRAQYVAHGMQGAGACMAPELMAKFAAFGRETVKAGIPAQLVKAGGANPSKPT